MDFAHTSKDKKGDKKTVKVIMGNTHRRHASVCEAEDEDV